MNRLTQAEEQANGKYLAHREIVSAVSEGPRARVFLNADYDHEVIHADHVAGENGLVVAVIANGRVVSYPLHAVRFIDWGLV
jgi:hypothetical protein